MVVSSGRTTVLSVFARHCLADLRRDIRQHGPPVGDQILDLRHHTVVGQDLRRDSEHWPRVRYVEAVATSSDHLSRLKQNLIRAGGLADVAMQVERQTGAARHTRAGVIGEYATRTPEPVLDMKR